MNLAVLGRKDKPEYYLPLVIGAVMPNIPTYLFYIYQKFIVGMPEIFIWGVAYFLPEWQMLFDFFHSIPIMLFGYFLSSQVRRRWLGAFFAGMILHSFFDLPVHHSDAHRHFFPLSDWRFESPLSCWDPHHFGFFGVSLEIFLVAAASLYILKWNKKRWVNHLVYAILLFYFIGTVFLVLYLKEII